MAHHTYRTKGLVLGNYDIGEAHIYVVIFTRELGLVRTVARSARTLRSRLRYHIQPLSFGDYSLVRGKEAWRLTGAKSNHNLYFEFAHLPEVSEFLNRYLLLLKRLLVDEGKHAELFDLVETGFAFLREENIDENLLQNLEYLMVLRTLLTLGYIGEHKALHDILHLSPITKDALESMSPLRQAAALEIDRALRESHL